MSGLNKRHDLNAGLDQNEDAEIRRWRQTRDLGSADSRLNRGDYDDNITPEEREQFNRSRRGAPKYKDPMNW